MSQCFNPNCLYQNPTTNKFCQKCGQPLLLKDHFRAIRYLGEGGFGRTFVAIDEHRRNSQCVIKQFLPLQQSSGALQKCIQLFEQEAELLEKLGKHPQIPDLLAFFDQDGKLYLVQEFIEGQDLLKELQTQGQFQESQVKTFLMEMLPILDFIHTKSVIHRDIKPENIIRRQESLDPLIMGKISDLVLIDFGVSKQVTATVMTKLGTGIVTPGYAAPEQSRGMVHPSSDLYSLAVTAIRLLTGVLPEERNGSIVDEIFDIYSLSWVWKEWLVKKGISINKDFAEVLDKMLADRVNERFLSAKDVLAALQSSSLTQSKPKLISPPSIPSPPAIKLQTFKADYRRLDQLLAQGNWKDADKETGKLMCKIMGREKEEWLTDQNCQNFPREKLRILDDLWIKYSQGRFGFSVQKQIWIDCEKVAKKFGNKVGWQRRRGDWIYYSDVTFNTNAPLGHLPLSVGVWGLRGVVSESGLVSLFSRLD